MKVTSKKKKEIVKKFKIHESDTGSPEVQIALLTERVKQLTEHLKKEQKDFHSRRGLEIMVSRRKRLLNYLRRKAPDRFKMIIDKLGLRV